MPESPDFDKFVGDTIKNQQAVERRRDLERTDVSKVGMAKASAAAHLRLAETREMSYTSLSLPPEKIGLV
jgi:hypothetical protein